MSLAVIALGTVTTEPTKRTSSAGKPYVTGHLRVPVDADDSLLVALICFDAKAGEDLLRHEKGDVVTVSGFGKLTEWTDKQGEAKRGIQVTVSAVLSPYEVKKRRKKPDDAEPRTAGMEAFWAGNVRETL